MQVIQQFTTDYFEKIKKEFESDSLFRQNHIVTRILWTSIQNDYILYI